MQFCIHRLFFWVSLVVLLNTCSVLGQVSQAKKLAPEDYSLWSTLYLEDFSTDGSWTTYRLSYESGLDTLFLQSTIGKQRFAYPKGTKSKFYKNQWFGCLEDTSTFRLTSLQGKESLTIPEVLDYYFTDAYLLFLKKSSGGQKELEVRDFKGRVLQSIVNISDYRFDDSTGKMILGRYEGGVGSVVLLDFHGKKIVSTDVLHTENRIFSAFYWQKNGTQFVFGGRDYSSLTDFMPYAYHYVLTSSKLFSVDLKERLGVVLSGRFTDAFGMHDNGLFMKVKPAVTSPSQDESVTVWHSLDKDLTLRRKFQENFSNSKLLFWEPETQQLRYVADEDHAGVLIPEKASYNLVFDPDLHKPFFTVRPYYDYYLKDLKSGVKTLLAKNVCSNENQLSVSPTAHYIAYFKECDWWVYDTLTRKTENVTQQLGVSFYNDSKERTNDSLPYGFMGWQADESGFYVYDYWDVWFVDLKTFKSKRLTNGKETQSVFRNAIAHKNSSQLFENSVVVSQPIFLIAKQEDHSKTGFFKLDAAKKLHTILWDSKRLSSLKVSKDGANCVFLSEDYDVPRSLVYKPDEGKLKVLFQSNPQHYQYSWGRSTLIRYQDSKGATLQGVLIYPIDYDAKKKYPMVVSIYERQTTLLHYYSNPSYLNGSHSNTTLLSHEGYFVFYPDIRYEIGNPGSSATDCVTSAVEAVLQQVSVDATKIGLMGQSFGGYETLFIITQTSLFATAISGAGLSDLVSGYLSVNDYTSDSNSWRYEYDQIRMGKPLYDDFEGYLKNSPLYHLPKVTVPLFTYTGAADTNVDVVHSMKYYLGMRRLEKEQVHVLYANQHHVFTSKEAQKDLTLKINDWFGHYLKGAPKKAWMQPR